MHLREGWIRAVTYESGLLTIAERVGITRHRFVHVRTDGVLPQLAGYPTVSLMGDASGHIEQSIMNEELPVHERQVLGLVTEIARDVCKRPSLV